MTQECLCLIVLIPFLCVLISLLKQMSRCKCASICCLYFWFVVVFLSALQGIRGIPPIPSGYNPATWVLEVTTPATEERIGEDFADIYKNSDQYRCF